MSTEYVPKTCSGCQTNFSYKLSPVYRELCLECYNNTKIKCDCCATMMVPETSRQNDGLCFDCYYNNKTESNFTDADRSAQLNEFTTENPLNLPGSYTEFLVSNTGRQGYRHKLTYKKYWRLYTLAKDKHCCSLADTICKVPHYRILQHLLSGYKDYFKRDWVKTANTRIPLSRMYDCVAIGEENGDILYLDPADGWSVWCFWHDGSDVKRLEDSFSDFLKSTKREFGAPKRTPKVKLPLVPQFVGFWRQDLDENSFLPADHYLYADGRARTQYVDEDTKKPRSESFMNWRLFGKNFLGIFDKHEFKYEIIDDNTLRSPESNRTFRRDPNAEFSGE